MAGPGILAFAAAALGLAFADEDAPADEPTGFNAGKDKALLVNGVVAGLVVAFLADQAGLESFSTGWKPSAPEEESEFDEDVSESDVKPSSSDSEEPAPCTNRMAIMNLLQQKSRRRWIHQTNQKTYPPPPLPSLSKQEETRTQSHGFLGTNPDNEKQTWCS